MEWLDANLHICVWKSVCVCATPLNADVHVNKVFMHMCMYMCMRRSQNALYHAFANGIYMDLKHVSTHTSFFISWPRKAENTTNDTNKGLGILATGQRVTSGSECDQSICAIKQHQETKAV